MQMFISLNTSAISPKPGYTEIIEGLAEGLVGFKEGDTTIIGPIPPEKAYGILPKVGDTIEISDPTGELLLERDLNLIIIKIKKNVSLPEEASNIVVFDKKLDKNIDKENIFVFVNKTKKLLEDYENYFFENNKKQNKKIKIEFNDLIETNQIKEYEIHYETNAAIATEKIINQNKKQITISSSLHYENILAYTKLPLES